MCVPTGFARTCFSLIKRKKKKTSFLFHSPFRTVVSSYLLINTFFSCIICSFFYIEDFRELEGRQQIVEYSFIKPLYRRIKQNYTLHPKQIFFLFLLHRIPEAKKRLASLYFSRFYVRFGSRDHRSNPRMMIMLSYCRGSVELCIMHSDEYKSG